MYDSPVYHIGYVRLTCLENFKIDSELTKCKKKFEDTKGVIRSIKSKNRQYNGQKKNNKSTNNDLHNTTQKPKD